MENEYLISNIAKGMFEEGSEHLQRIAQYGKKVCKETLYTKKLYLKVFLENFGNYDLRKLKVREIQTFLLNDVKHSGSWKNNFLDVVGTVYDETIWKCPNPITRPKFQRFCRNTKKCNVFNDEELQIIFNSALWENKTAYLLFKTMECCGLRIGEARAIQKNQFLWKSNSLIINGFCKVDGSKTDYNKKGSADNQKFRIVPIPKTLEDDLKHYVNKFEDDEFIFSKDGKKPFSKDILRNNLKRVLKKAGIDTTGKKLVPHSFRYTYITKMRQKFSVEQLQKIAGHSSIEMTEYYTRSSMNNLIENLQSLTPIINQIF